MIVLLLTGSSNRSRILRHDRQYLAAPNAGEVWRLGEPDTCVLFFSSSPNKCLRKAQMTTNKPDSGRSSNCTPPSSAPACPAFEASFVAPFQSSWGQLPRRKIRTTAHQLVSPGRLLSALGLWTRQVPRSLLVQDTAMTETSFHCKKGIVRGIQRQFYPRQRIRHKRCHRYDRPRKRRSGGQARRSGATCIRYKTLVGDFSSPGGTACPRAGISKAFGEYIVVA